MRNGQRFSVDVVRRLFGKNGEMEYLDTDPSGDHPHKFRFYGASGLPRQVRISQEKMDQLEKELNDGVSE